MSDITREDLPKPPSRPSRWLSSNKLLPRALRGAGYWIREIVYPSPVDDRGDPDLAFMNTRRIVGRGPSWASGWAAPAEADPDWGPH